MQIWTRLHLFELCFFRLGSNSIDLSFFPLVCNTEKWAGGGTQRMDLSEYLMWAMWDAA